MRRKTQFERWSEVIALIDTRLAEPSGMCCGFNADELRMLRRIVVAALAEDAAACACGAPATTTIHGQPWCGDDR